MRALTGELILGQWPLDVWQKLYLEGTSAVKAPTSSSETPSESKQMPLREG